MSVREIRVNNYSVFDDIKIDTAAAVNVIVGQNGTGKTHLLKYIYVASKVDKSTLDIDFLRQYGVPFDRSDYPVQGYLVTDKEESSLDALYIPVKDMLTHAKGLLSMAEKYRDFPFDRTLTDIIKRANQWTVKEPTLLAKAILPYLERMMDGQVVVQDEEFYIRKHDERMVSFAVEAEGLKKIGLLWQLLMTENIHEDMVLLWDEPEANLNPEFFPDLVECLLELSRHNIQIFVSTHNYIFAKYFDVRRRQEDKIFFHALYPGENGVHCETKNTFAELEHNAIADTFNALLNEVYDLQVGD